MRGAVSGCAGRPTLAHAGPAFGMMAFLMRRNLLCIGLALAVAAGLVGCARPALSSHATENPHIAYERLFTRDGCEIGRFIDYGRPVYVTLCPALGVSASQSSWVESCGKNCYQTVDRHQTQVRGGAAGPGGPAGGEAALSEPGRAR